MKLIVLGNYGTFPGKDGACSGFLLQDKNFNVLIDAGNGTMGRLQRYIRIEDLDAIILSHLHYDHTSDIYVLRYAVETKFALKTMQKLINVYAPGSPEDEMNRLLNYNVFNVSAISENMAVNINNAEIRFFRMKHSIETYGVRVKYGEKVFAYSADTLYNDNIIHLAKDANLFLCESTATAYDKSRSSIPHLSAMEAASAARDANVKKLLLTHFWFESNKSDYLNEARSVFNNTELSEELKEYEI